MKTFPLHIRSFLLVIAFASPLFSFSQVDSTTIATTLYAEMYGKGNVVYCSSLELLWKEFANYLGEEPKPEELHLEINNLNKVVSDYTPPLEQQFWFAHVGKVDEGIVDTISNSYQNQFGMSWQPREYGTNDLIGHSYLKKNLNFYSRLDDDFEQFLFKDSTHVKCFGLEGGWANPTYKKQLKIHDYKNEDDFIFQMGCKDSLDVIYFAKIPMEGNLMETYNAVMTRVKKNDVRYIDRYDHLQIPYLKFDITKDFEYLRNVKLTNPDYNQLAFKELSQRISFDLNKDGVRIESVQELLMVEFGYSEIKPFVYAFDQPFLIVIKRKDSPMPYFLFWVQNAQHMEIIE